MLLPVVIPGRAEGANPDSRVARQTLGLLWIPDRRHSASKTHVNALMAASGITAERFCGILLSLRPRRGRNTDLFEGMGHGSIYGHAHERLNPFIEDLIRRYV